MGEGTEGWIRWVSHKWLRQRGYKIDERRLMAFDHKNKDGRWKIQYAGQYALGEGKAHEIICFTAMVGRSALCGE